LNSQATLPDEQVDLRAYAYSYPHKSAYRPLRPPIPLADVWRDEDVRHLSLYVHVPFCEMRCGFCNLFTHSQPATDVVDAFLNTLLRQLGVTRRAIPTATFSSFALGGGTPTYLSPSQLEHLLSAVEDRFDLSIATLPTSVETSPVTATHDRLAMLRSYGVQRISIGVQSFEVADLQAFGRPRQCSATYDALERIRRLGFPILNIDLIYGTADQTADSWHTSLTEALRFEPEELYLYPLYVRRDTGLDRIKFPDVAHRVDLYRLGAEFLSNRGYRQTSLRSFQRKYVTTTSGYACQRDGMVGLGCGARSYTRSLHYATRFAVRQAGIKAILSSWIGQSDQDLALATHGIRLSLDEQRRRYLIMSVLQADGMSLADYQNMFESSAFDDLPELAEFRRRGWLDETAPGVLRLTAAGLESSDAAGPLLYSPHVRRRLEEFTRR
jgi:oxygen-independent coproporphyrinogen-3 oxidase